MQHGMALYVEGPEGSASLALEPGPHAEQVPDHREFSKYWTEIMNLDLRV